MKAKNCDILCTTKERGKIMDINEMKKCNMMELQQIHRLKEKGKSIIFVNGCFDLFHVGHLSLLEFAKPQGDVLVVGVNSDQSIKQIKGVIDNVDRPIIDEDSRLRIIKALKCVDFAILFDENHPGCLIKDIVPDVIVKGDDYKYSHRMINAEESESIRNAKSQVRLFHRVEGVSTSDIIRKIRHDKNFKCY